MGAGARAATVAAGIAVVAVVVWRLLPAPPLPSDPQATTPAPVGAVSDTGVRPDAGTTADPAVDAGAPPRVVPEPDLTAEPAPDAMPVLTPEPEVAREMVSAPEVFSETPTQIASGVTPVPDVAQITPDPVLPSFDNYRVEADGSAVIAGRAEPGAMISVLVDGRPVAQTRAGGDGSFAALFSLPPNTAPSLMTLQQDLPDGRKTGSMQSVALGPIAGPLVVATAPPEPPPAPQPAPAPQQEPMGDSPPDSALAPSPVQAGSAPATAVLPPAAEPSAMPPERTRGSSDQVAAAQPEPPQAAARAVSAPPIAPPVALLLSPDGATVGQAPGADMPQADPSTVAAVLLEVISYAPSGAVQLSGKGQAGQMVRIYLNNAPVSDAPIAATGLWQVTLGDTAPGIYTLRVDQVDAAGKVTARFETPFKRETLESLAALSQPQRVAEPAQGSDGASTSAQPTPAPVSGASVPAPSAAIPSAPTLSAPADPMPPGTVAASQSAPSLPGPATPPAQVVADAAAAIAPPPPPVSVTVQPGFTLWGIARENFGEGVMYVQVYEANRDKIRDPDLIYPGQVFAIPPKP